VAHLASRTLGLPSRISINYASRHSFFSILSGSHTNTIRWYLQFQGPFHPSENHCCCCILEFSAFLDCHLGALLTPMLNIHYQTCIALSHCDGSLSTTKTEVSNLSMMTTGAMNSSQVGTARGGNALNLHATCDRDDRGLKHCC